MLIDIGKWKCILLVNSGLRLIIGINFIIVVLGYDMSKEMTGKIKKAAILIQPLLAKPSGELTPEFYNSFFRNNELEPSNWPDVVRCAGLITAQKLKSELGDVAKTFSGRIELGWYRIELERTCLELRRQLVVNDIKTFLRRRK